MKKPQISVIIPCLNEVNTIGSVVSAASDELSKSGFDYEIIVVDNGSNDGSERVAKSHGANVIHSEARTIAGVRNAGVKISRGEVLLFLDADTVVQPGWGQAFRPEYKRMKENDNFITGSPAHAPDNIQPILYSWYKALSDNVRDTHRATYHMIVSRKTFKKIGGFDENFITNEDFNFCSQAKKHGVIIDSNPEMKVFHHGYPNSLIDFAKREIWHGLGDCKNWKSRLRSRVFWCGTLFLLLNIVMIFCLFFYIPLFFILLATALLMAAGMNFVKFGYGNIRDFTYRSLVSYVYLISRGLSLPVRLFRKDRFYHWVHSKKS